MSYIIRNFQLVCYPSASLPNKILQRNLFLFLLCLSAPDNWRIDSDHEKKGMYYLDDRVSPTGLVVGQPDPTILWYWRLGHSSLKKLRSQFILSLLSLP